MRPSVETTSTPGVSFQDPTTASADVEELPDPRLDGQEPDRPPQERAVPRSEVRAIGVLASTFATVAWSAAKWFLPPRK